MSKSKLEIKLSCKTGKLNGFTLKMHSYECLFLILSLVITIAFGCFTVNRLHERCLRMIYNNKQSKLEELLIKNNYVSIHRRTIQQLAIQMYAVTNHMTSDMMS